MNPVFGFSVFDFSDTVVAKESIESTELLLTNLVTAGFVTSGSENSKVNENLAEQEVVYCGQV